METKQTTTISEPQFVNKITRAAFNKLHHYVRYSTYAYAPGWVNRRQFSEPAHHTLLFVLNPCREWFDIHNLEVQLSFDFTDLDFTYFFDFTYIFFLKKDFLFYKKIWFYVKVRLYVLFLVTNIYVKSKLHSILIP